MAEPIGDNVPLTLEEPLLIGENGSYRFYVARLGDRWVGYASESKFTIDARHAFASSGLPVQAGMLFLFPEVAEGVELGMLDRAKAIRLTAAIALDPEHSYGGIDRWHVGEELRPGPEEFRCEHCGQVGCEGECWEDRFDGEVDA